MARGRGRTFSRPPPRTKMWIGNGVGASTVVGNAKLLIASLSASAFLLRPFTILRTRLEINLVSDQAAVDEVPTVTLGQIVVTDTAVAIGVTAIPDPSGISGDPEADWYVFQAMIVRFKFLSSVGFHPAAGTNYPVDSKAMRKVGPDDNIALMASSDSAAGAIITTSGRMLIQFH